MKSQFLQWLVCGAALTFQLAGYAGTNSPALSPATTEGSTTRMTIKEHCSGAWTPGLSADEKAVLFAIVEDTLLWGVKGGGRGDFNFEKYKLTEKLRQPMATFVTLKERGALRGCIGSLAPVAPLYQSVHDNAISAALQDSRFRPVAPHELPLLEVHVSVLSPIREIKALDEFKLGEHGIILEKGGSRAVYLPEVAIEQKWTRDETLDSLSEKAGLSPGAWRSGARFKVFSSVVMSR
jgi:AmmeMemoRadiSam system protein A